MEMINGYRCKDCTDVAYAKKNIDPAHPKDGPFGINRVDQPLQTPPQDAFGPAVKIGDQPVNALQPSAPASPSRDTGNVFDVSA